jgi:hypothetical protein
MEQPAKITQGRKRVAVRIAARTFKECIGGMLVRRKRCGRAELRVIH